MITLSNGNSYQLSQINLSLSGNVTGYYTVTNTIVQADGFPSATVTLNLSAMPGLVPVFAEPMSTPLPTLDAMESWIISDHSSDGQTALQMYTGGTLS